MTDDFWNAFSKSIKPLKQPTGGHRIPDQVNPFNGPGKERTRRVEVVIQPREWKGEAPEKWSHQAVTTLQSKDVKKKTVEARLDLHGYRTATAETALSRFMINAQSNNHRFVLVITGKGKPDFGSIIRDFTLDWFKSHPEFVVGYSESSPKDGGAGAFYVHVRRLRL